MEEKQRNSDRHLCKTCKFREHDSNTIKIAKKISCIYILIKQHSRGCSCENCSKYEKGEPIKRKVNPYGQYEALLMEELSHKD